MDTRAVLLLSDASAGWLVGGNVFAATEIVETKTVRDKARVSCQWVTIMK